MEKRKTILSALVLIILFELSTANNNIICHDCTGVDECSLLLKNDWTGKCTALITGKCFIRQDPNGILYRGCADSLNWPHDLDMTYTGCRYQTYGEWSDKEVLWCFCNQSLCNVNITYIQSVHPGASSAGVQQGQTIRGQVVISEGTGHWHRVIGGRGSSSSSSAGSAGSASSSQIITQNIGQNQGQSGVRIQRIGLIVQGQDHSQGGAQAASNGFYQVQGLSDVQLKGQGYLIQSHSSGQVDSSGVGGGQVSSGSVGVKGQSGSVQGQSDIQGYLLQGQSGSVQGQSGIQGFLVQGQSGNQASGSVYDLNDGSLLQASQRPLVVDPLIYAVTAPSGGANNGGGLIQPPVVVKGTPVQGSSVNVDWDAVQKYIKEAKKSAGQFRPVNNPPAGINQPVAKLPAVVIVSGGGNALRPSSTDNFNGGLVAQPTIAQPTTTPTINIAAITSSGSGSGSGSVTARRPPTSVEELFSILNGLLIELHLTTLTPATNVTQRLGFQLIFDLPNDLLTYLRTNLPRDTSNIQSLPYPLYIILYLLSIAGYNINNIVPGLNTSYAGLVPTPALDIVVNPTNQTNVLASICPSDFIVQPSLGSCYKIITPNVSMSPDAKSVAQARARCNEISRLANLASVDSLDEITFLAGLLRRESVMLDGWQGWWTSGSYRAGVNQFYWETGDVIPNTKDYWGFQKNPFKDTCVWILQIPNYNYTLANYDCLTASGYICEIKASQASQTTQAP